MTGRRYLPAASLDILLPVYDPIMKLLRFTAALDALVAQAALAPSFRVLDIGCGTPDPIANPANPENPQDA